MPEPLFSQVAPAATVLPTAASPAAAKNQPGQDAVEFSSAFTGTGKSSVDISRFETGATVLPGSYNVDIFVNEARVERRNMEFRAIAGATNAEPCFTYAEMVRFGVDVSKLDPVAVNPRNVCIAIREVSPDATARMDMGELRLDVSIPQASMKNNARGYVSPDLWDDGETALLVGYNFNVYASSQSYAAPPAPYGNSTGNNAVGGAFVPVQNGTYYTQTASGIRVLGAHGVFLPSPNGTYVALSDSNTASPQEPYRVNDVNAFLGLNLGLNLGGWHLRTQSTGTWDKLLGRSQWDSISTTASHDVTALLAQFSVGNGYTQGVLFDTTPYLGVTLYSDDRMRPDSQAGYAPVVRGMANTQARVEVRQSGNLLYETTVAPGPFVINDLYSTGYGGDLTVIVFEADGSTHSYVVPYSAVPMLLRPGVNRWALTGGRVDDSSLSRSAPYFFEGTYQRGINNWLTLYGGLQTTDDSLYRAYLGGAALNTPVGALSLDVTNSETDFRGWSSLSGYSARLTYSKAIPSTDTTFALATYRYSNGNYVSLSQAVTTQDRLTDRGITAPGEGSLVRAKQSVQVTLNQNFAPGYGALYATASYNNFWNQSNNATTFQLGYNNNFRRLNYGIVASRTYGATPVYRGSRYDNQIGINLSIPLGGSSSSHAPMLTASTVHDDVTGNDGRAGISGTFGQASQFNYSGNVSYSDTTPSATTWSFNTGWQAPYASLNTGYSWASHYQQASTSASGGLVVHGGGITWSPQIDPNGAIAIVEAPDAQGARVASSGQTEVNSHGYAVATGLTPYRMNDVVLDPVGTSADVELQTTRLQTAPRAGAVVPLTFTTVSGRAALIHATRANGDVLPFGAEVTDEQGHAVGSVAQSSQLLVRGAEDGGVLTVHWGDAADQQCHIQYSLPPRTKGADSTGFTAVDAVCR